MSWTHNLALVLTLLPSPATAVTEQKLETAAKKALLVYGFQPECGHRLTKNGEAIALTIIGAHYGTLYGNHPDRLIQDLRSLKRIWRGRSAAERRSICTELRGYVPIYNRP